VGSNLITKATQARTLTGAHPEIAGSGLVTFRTVVEFSDSGAVVNVERPAGGGK